MRTKMVIRLGSAALALTALLVAALFAAEATSSTFYFHKEPFIHPKIIEDLSTWESDNGEQVVAINLLESMGTNRYFGEIRTNGKENPFIFYENTEACEESPCPFGPPIFGYRLIGTTPSGVDVLFTEQSGGGSGRFRNLLLVTLEKDNGLSYDRRKKTLRLDRERWIVKKLLEIALGDRYEGEIAVKGNALHIGKDRYSHSAELFKKDTVLNLEVVH